jgi:site-specific recombinase XerD|nr:MAG TPA: SITE SPECIFIC RECOMBINASE XERD [Caudoviricetes sp.]
MVNNDMERLINGYIKYLQEIKNLSPKSIKSYIPVVKEMIEYCGFKRIDDIQNSTIIQLQNWLNKKKNEGLSNQSLNRRIASCKSFYGYLVAFRLVNFNASEELKQLPIQGKKYNVDINKVKEIRNFMKNKYNNKPSFKNLRDTLMIDVMLCCGLRNMELRSLNIDSIDEYGRFQVRQKGNTIKECNLNSSTLELYRKYLSERLKIKAKDDSLFISSYRTRISEGGLEKVITTLCQDMGINHLTPHSFRHMCCSSLVQNNIPIEKVAKILGHSSTRVTFSTYYHQSEGDRKDIVESNPIFN